MLRMFSEKGYSSVTRRSMIDRPEFKQKMQINGIDVAQLYLDTLHLGAKGYMVYRTVPPYPQVDHEIDVAIQNIVSQAEIRQGGDGAGAAERADAAEARRRKAVGIGRHARRPGGRHSSAARSAPGCCRR